MNNPILDWEENGLYFCRKCKNAARQCPEKKYVWGCVVCKMQTDDLIEHFFRAPEVYEALEKLVDLIDSRHDLHAVFTVRDSIDCIYARSVLGRETTLEVSEGPILEVSGPRQLVYTQDLEYQKAEKLLLLNALERCQILLWGKGYGTPSGVDELIESATLTAGNERLTTGLPYTTEQEGANDE